MKKILVSLLLVSAVTFGAFAFDLGDFPTGSWVDEKWNAEWEIAVNAITLKDNTSGEVIFTFTESNVTDFKLTPSSSGISITFACKETQRSYEFRKPISLDTSVELTVDPDWRADDYTVNMPFKQVNR